MLQLGLKLFFILLIMKISDGKTITVILKKRIFLLSYLIKFFFGF